MKLLLAAFLGTTVLLLVAIARRGAPAAETRDEYAEATDAAMNFGDGYHEAWAIAQRVVRDHEMHEAEMCGDECISLGLADFGDYSDGDPYLTTLTEGGTQR